MCVREVKGNEERITERDCPCPFVCVCVCVRERERVCLRDRESNSQ